MYCVYCVCTRLCVYCVCTVFVLCVYCVCTVFVVRVLLGGGGPTLFLSVDFVNILPKKGGGQTLMSTIRSQNFEVLA